VTETVSVDAWELLDSRGHPTVRVEIETAGTIGRFTVSSGASTGNFEALEHRDGEGRYRGRGVQKAVRAVREELAPVAEGMNVHDQRAVDAALVYCDGTDN